MGRTSTSRALLEFLRAENVTPAVETVAAPVAVLLAARLAQHEPILPGFFPDGFDKAWASLRNGPRPIAPLFSVSWSVLKKRFGFPAGERDSLFADRPLELSERALTALIEWVAAFDLAGPSGRSEASDAFSDLLRALTEGYVGGYVSHTPSSIARLMVALIGPQPDEVICDPCFGTGELLLAAAEIMLQRQENYRPIALWGTEVSDVLGLIACVRLVLAGVVPNLRRDDALAPGIPEDELPAGVQRAPGFDCILMNPPWGKVYAPERYAHFPVHARVSESLYIQHAVGSLRDGGRAAILVPPGILFRGGADHELREWLLETCRVDLVAKLPNKTLGYTSVAPHLLMVTRGARTETVRFADIERLPESSGECSLLASELLAPEGDGWGRARLVAVADVIKDGSRLVPRSPQDVRADERFDELAKRIELRRLKDVAEIVPGIATPSNKVTDRKRGIPFVRISDLGEGVLRVGGRYVSDVRARDEQWVRRGDVLVSTRGTIGKALLVSQVQFSKDHEQGLAGGSDALALANNGLAILRPREQLDPRFLAAILQSDLLQHTLRAGSRGTATAYLPVSELAHTRIPVPPREVQARVLTRLSERPGDALDALYAVLGTAGEEDALAKFLRENPSTSFLTGEGMPEADELYQRGREAFRALRMLRNEAAHNRVDIDPLALKWLLLVGAVPLFSTRRSEELSSYESLEATAAMLEQAHELTLKLSGSSARSAGQLTERLRSWVKLAIARTTSDFRLLIDGQIEPSVNGDDEAAVFFNLDSRAPLLEFTARLDVADGVLSVPELADEEAVLRAQLRPDLAWSRTVDSLELACRVVWSANTVTGEPVQGETSLLLRKPLAEATSSAPADLGASPYIAGDVVETPEMFFGREAVLDDIKTHLNGGTKVILLEGNRRTGKTSILRKLQRPEEGLLEKWLPVECSFQGTTGHATKEGIPTLDLFRLIVLDIGLACAKAGHPVPLPEMKDVPADINLFRFRFSRGLAAFFEGLDPYEALQIYVDMVSAAIAPKRLLLMFDEFDKVQVGIDNGITSPQVPENIRNLLQRRAGLAAILTGSRRLKRLRDEYWSALFGFGHTIGVQPLEPPEVERLVRQPVAGRLTFDEAAVHLIADVTSRQPYLVQALCARIFELAKSHGWKHIRREETLDAIGRMVRVNEHFQALWDYAATERRRYLICLCGQLGDAGERVNASVLNEVLAQRGIIVPIEHVDDDITFLSELELITLQNSGAGPQYRLTIPLMKRWMDANVDADAQRRKAQKEVLSSTSLAPVDGADDDDPFLPVLCDTCGAPMAKEPSAPSGAICYGCTEVPSGGFANADVVYPTKRVKKEGEP